jgi:predicted AAA+ superfamily ATPase
MQLLREYYVVGGMPGAVENYRHMPDGSLGAYEKVREIQGELLAGFLGDFSKYTTGVNARHIAAVFESIPRHLGREQKKFKAADVMPGGRFSTLQRAVDWLEGAGLVCKVPITVSGERPFSAFTQENRYKLYFMDTGLLGAAANLSPQVIALGNDLFATFKGAFCENFIAQEFLYATGEPLFGWANNTSEIEFLREVNGVVYPIEVKSGLSGKLKSLNVFASKYHTPIRVRFSSQNLEINRTAGMHSYPLYMASRFPLPQSSVD